MAKTITVCGMAIHVTRATAKDAIAAIFEHASTGARIAQLNTDELCTLLDDIDDALGSPRTERTPDARLIEAMGDFCKHWRSNLIIGTEDPRETDWDPVARAVQDLGFVSGWLTAALQKARTSPVGPIPMRLTCPMPSCGELHIDEGWEGADKPHHTHVCQACGHTWRPAIVPTKGVRFLPGFKNQDKDKSP